MNEMERKLLEAMSRKNLSVCLRQTAPLPRGAFGRPDRQIWTRKV